MIFRIRYTTSTGTVSALDVEADTQDEALRLSKVLPKRVISIGRANVFDELLDFPPQLPDQVSFLSALAAAVTAGHGADKEFLALVERDRNLKHKLDKVRAKVLTSERLKVLKFSSTAVMLAEMGERSQTLGKSLTTAAATLSENEKIRREMSKGVTPQIIMILVLLAALCAVPYVFGPIIDELSQPGVGVQVKKNLLTHFVLGIRSFLNLTWPVLAVLFVVGFVFKSNLWNVLKDKPLFRNLDELGKAKRGIDFISSFMTLDNAGVPALEFLNRVMAGLPKKEKHVYQEMIDAVSAGKPLSETFNEEWFPRMMCRAVTGMEKSEREGRRENLLLLRKNLMSSVEALSDKITKQFKLLGWLMMFIVAANMLIGLYLPLMTLSAF